MSDRPNIGDHVGYVTKTDTDELETRMAVVIGYWDTDEVHLAVLDEAGANLDLMTMAVPADQETGRYGTWHRLASREPQDDEEHPESWPADTETTSTITPVSE